MQLGEVFGRVDSISVRRDRPVVEGADNGDEEVNSPDFFEIVLGGDMAVLVGEVEAGQVDAIDGGIGGFFGLVEFGEPVDAGVWDGDDCLFDGG